MTKLVIDAAMSIDGFWADEAWNSVFPVDEMHDAGLVEELTSRTGAVIMSRRSFEMADDPDWYACNYEHQGPIHVVTDAPPQRHPKEDGGLTFTFVPTFAEALQRARAAAGAKDVMVIGEKSMVEAALLSGEVDEIYLRLVARTVGAGTRLIDTPGIIPQDYRINAVRQTEHVVHIHLVR
jgi:dihydrofolate reductase